MAGTEFNINSPKQLSGILYEQLKLPIVKKTKTGASTDEWTLRRLASHHELPVLLLKYRELAKLKSTYIDGLPKLINPKTSPPKNNLKNCEIPSITLSVPVAIKAIIILNNTIATPSLNKDSPSINTDNDFPTPNSLNIPITAIGSVGAIIDAKSNDIESGILINNLKTKPIIMVVRNVPTKDNNVIDLIFFFKTFTSIFIAPSNKSAGKNKVNISSGSSSIPICILNTEIPSPVRISPNVYGILILLTNIETIETITRISTKIK